MSRVSPYTTGAFRISEPDDAPLQIDEETFFAALGGQPSTLRANAPPKPKPRRGKDTALRRLIRRLRAYWSMGFFVLFPARALFLSVFTVVQVYVDVLVLLDWSRRGYVYAVRAGQTFMLFAFILRMRIAWEGTLFQPCFALWGLDAYTWRAAILRTTLTVLHLERFLLYPLMLPCRKRVWAALSSAVTDAPAGVGWRVHMGRVLDVFEMSLLLSRDHAVVADLCLTRSNGGPSPSAASISAAASAAIAQTAAAAAAAAAAAVAAADAAAAASTTAAVPSSGARRPAALAAAAAASTSAAVPSSGARRRNTSGACSSGCRSSFSDCPPDWDDSAAGGTFTDTQSEKAVPAAAVLLSADSVGPRVSAQAAAHRVGAPDPPFAAAASATAAAARAAASVAAAAAAAAATTAAATVAAASLLSSGGAAYKKPLTTHDIALMVIDAEMDMSDVKDSYVYLTGWEVFSKSLGFILVQVYVFLHVGRISEVSLISITMTTLSHAYFMQYGSLQSKFGYGLLNQGPSCNIIHQTSNLLFILSCVSGRLLLMVALLLKSTHFVPAGLLIVFSGLVNFVASDLFVYSSHRGASERDMCLTISMQRKHLEAISKMPLVMDGMKLFFTLQYLYVNRWVVILAPMGTGWKWKHRRLASPLNFVVRIIENTVIWAVILADPNVCRRDSSSGWPRNESANPWRPCLMTWWSAAGIALTSNLAMVISFLLYWPWQFRYLDGLNDDDTGPGRGGCSLRDDSGELRSFRPLNGEELALYVKLQAQTESMREYFRSRRGYVQYLRETAPWWPGRPSTAAAAAAASGGNSQGGGAGPGSAVVVGAAVQSSANTTPP